MALKRDFKQTIADRARRDLAFARALCDEALTLIRAGEGQTARAMLGDLADVASSREAPPVLRRGRQQPDAIDANIPELPGHRLPKSATLAAELGLIGGLRSAEGDLASNHSQRLEQRLRARRTAAAMPMPEAAEPASPTPARRRAAKR